MNISQLFKLSTPPNLASHFSYLFNLASSIHTHKMHAHNEQTLHEAISEALHQIGAWFGGIIYDAYGTYMPVWWMSVAQALVSAVLHLPIDARPVSREYSALKSTAA